jgi:2,4-dienoyl-CoA reductase-like NADH-dependent reductase (Old Yellow Enzyme family)
MQSILQPYDHGNLHLRNRIIKSGVYEGRSDQDGFPSGSYAEFYEMLAKNDVGGIITGFAYVSKEGRAMHPRQAGIDDPQKIPYFRKATDAVHRHGCPIFLQIAHTGRQTLQRVTGTTPRSCSSKSSIYFRAKPMPLLNGEVYLKIKEFADAACLAREAGFDGIQLHAAHGYLIHQFLLPAVNDRKDEFGIDDSTGIGSRFLEEVIYAVQSKCGSDFPILVKISGGIDLQPDFSHRQLEELVKFLNRMPVAAIEISYGTMDHALNIFRGDVPEDLILSRNPIFGTSNVFRKTINRAVMHQVFIKKLKPFTPAYNLEFASIARKISAIPIISVGGFRTGEEIMEAVFSGKTDLVGLARPFICEPDFIKKLIINGSYESQCINCNLCSIMCDSMNETRCYKPKSN